MTYIRIKGGWCYLAVVLDLYARHVVGFAVSESPDSVLTAKALQMAYHTRLKPNDVLFHSDQGTHYTSNKFAESVADCDGLTQSMSRRGNPLRVNQCFANLLILAHGIMHQLKGSSGALKQNGCQRAVMRISLRLKAPLLIISGAIIKP